MADGDERSPGAKAAAITLAPAVLTHAIGTFAGWDPERGPLVNVPTLAGPVPAVTIVPLDAVRVHAAIAAGQRIVLAFDGGRADAPIVVGLLQSPGEPPSVAQVDGKRVVIDAADEIVLRCGEASITLRRNGRVVIRGTAVETRAKGVNRIRGGSVQIN